MPSNVRSDGAESVRVVEPDTIDVEEATSTKVPETPTRVVKTDSIGARGADGADGPDGADGADGPEGPEGPQGPGGTINQVRNNGSDLTQRANLNFGTGLAAVDDFPDTETEVNIDETYLDTVYAAEARLQYRHVQGAASATWVVAHNLGYRPGGIEVIDSGNNRHEADITHDSANQVTLSFVASFSGEAYLS